MRDDYVKNPEALQLTKFFSDCGFRYKGIGGGGLAGLIAGKLREGYTRDKLMEALEKTMTENARGKICDHTKYYLTVLDSICPYGAE